MCAVPISTAGDLGSSRCCLGKASGSVRTRGSTRVSHGRTPAWGAAPAAAGQPHPPREPAPPPPGETDRRQQRGPEGRPSPPQPAAPAVPSPRAERRGGGGGSPVTHACVEADQPAIHAFKKANPSTSGKKGHLALNSAARLVFRRRFWQSL